VIEPDDDDGHVVATVLAVVTHRLRAAHVQDLKIKINFSFSLKSKMHLAIIKPPKISVILSIILLLLKRPGPLLLSHRNRFTLK
jgi:hypothetical protein